MADAAKPAAGRGDLPVEHRIDIWQPQICEADDPAIIGASSYVPPPGLMDDPNFRRGLKRLPAHDLTFEAWIYHPQIKTLMEVARECPDVKIVLNHFGGPLGVGPHAPHLPFAIPAGIGSIGWKGVIRWSGLNPNFPDEDGAITARRRKVAEMQTYKP